MPEIEVNIDVWCECGKPLCQNTTSGTTRGRPSFTVEPCESCLDKARQEGRDDGQTN